MDGYREFPSEFDEASSVDSAAAAEQVAAVIGTDERRMHVRAYNYWVSLLDGRDFPSIEDLEPADLEDFSSHSVLLDFTCGRDNPALPYVGNAIREECALDDDVRTIADVPGRSLLSRLTDHYMQIIANRAPVGFEAEFENPRGESLCYRGILMPFSSDGDTIDFIYGVINWKTVGSTAAVDSPVQPVEADAIKPETDELILDEPVEPVIADAFQPMGIELPGEDEISEPDLVLGDDPGLADRLSAARETAESVKAGDVRTRAALYQALSLAYDFALAAEESPEDYSELLEDSGVKAQARAPMTPIAKLVFGIDYDKARLTEFAAALSYARRQATGAGGFRALIEAQAGGLKGLVAAERQARRPDAKPDGAGEAARGRLRAAAAISLAEVRSTEEFAILITRRGSDGHHEPVAIVDDPALVERAIRKAA